MRDSSTGLKRPARSVLSDETHDVIRAMLLNHSIAPGTHINIDALARDLHVSQTPVREALARLESTDLVVKQPLRGYSATELLTARQVDDLFQFRSLVEPWAAAQAAARHTEDGARRLAAEIARGRSAGSASDMDKTYAAMSEHDARFHELVSRLSGSEFVHDAFVRTHCHLHLFRLYRASQSARADGGDAELAASIFGAYYQPQSGFLAFREHEGIADAILARDSIAAHDLMLHHIESSRERFSPTLAQLTP